MVGRRGPPALAGAFGPGARGGLIAGTTIALDDEERHHLRVRRAAAGERVRVLDGAGAVAEGAPDAGQERLRGLGGSARRRSCAPPGFTLVVGAGDKERFGWLAEKSAELGVTELVPLKTERTRSVAAGIREGHVLALQRRARQAIKQSGAAWAPPRRADRREVRRGLQGSRHPPLARRRHRRAAAELPPDVPLVVVVGPEGGLIHAEREIFLAADFRRFGSRPTCCASKPPRLPPRPWSPASAPGGIDE